MLSNCTLLSGTKIQSRHKIYPSRGVSRIFSRGGGRKYFMTSSPPKLIFFPTDFGYFENNFGKKIFIFFNFVLLFLNFFPPREGRSSLRPPPWIRACIQEIKYWLILHYLWYTLYQKKIYRSEYLLFFILSKISHNIRYDGRNLGSEKVQPKKLLIYEYMSEFITT